jgi:hypothetical protein
MARAQAIKGLNAHAATRASLPLMFSSRITELWGWAEHLQYPERVRELHDMRIAAKRLRYLFEFFEPCFAPDFKEHLKLFKQLQDYLGEIHDCDVWVDYLRDQLAGAFKELNQARKALGSYTGAGPELGPAAAELRGRLAQGPVQGLLMMIAGVVDRRDKLYGELLGFWAELERDGFRAALIGAVAQAARGENQPQAGG